MGFDSNISGWIKTLSRSDDIFRRAVVENQEEIIDLNTAQLEVGRDSLGNLLDEYASSVYDDFKKSIVGSRSPKMIPDLKLEGDFYEGFVLRYQGSEFFLTSTDEKKDRLRDKYGDDIFGLTEESLDEIRPAILESFLIMFRNGLL